MTVPKAYSREFLESLRTTAFDIHPEIMGAAAELPRRADGSEYDEPESGAQTATYDA